MTDEQQSRQRALDHARGAHAELHKVPAAGLNHSQHERFESILDDLGSLEAEIANEVDQLQEDGQDGE